MSELKENLEDFLEKPKSENISQQNRSDDVKLPRIQLLSFTGKYEEWQTF